MITPNDRILEILTDGIVALDKEGHLSAKEIKDVNDYVEYLQDNIDDQRPEGADE